MQARTIDDVIEMLTDIIQQEKRRRSRVGYFPGLYRKVTVAVKEGIAAGSFEDGDRMEALDVHFANRYLDAWSRYRAGDAPTGSWSVSFQAAQDWYPLVLQHLLLGMNAHINLDLGAAAWQTSPGSELAKLHEDFNRINDILSGLVDEVKRELTQVWPGLAGLDRLAGNAEDRIVDFSMARARDSAWKQAVELNALPRGQEVTYLMHKDRWVSGFGREVWRPPPAVRVGLLFLRHCERGTVPEIIEILE